MKINKLEPSLFMSIQESLKNHLLAMHQAPQDINIKQLNIVRIRYIKDWKNSSTTEHAFIVELATTSNRHLFILSDSELELSIDQFKELFEEQSKNGLLFAKSFLIHQEWYEYPVVMGILDPTFDENIHYEPQGKYHSNDYQDFPMLYDES